MGHQAEALSGSSPVVSPLKPLLRGVSHQHAFFAAVAAGIMLVLSAPTRQGKLACSIYATTLSTLYGVSATYHRNSWKPEVNAVLIVGCSLLRWDGVEQMSEMMRRCIDVGCIRYFDGGPLGNLRRRLFSPETSGHALQRTAMSFYRHVAGSQLLLSTSHDKRAPPPVVEFCMPWERQIQGTSLERLYLGVYPTRSLSPEACLQARALMRRLDHSSIFLLIAGTYTPLCVLCLHDAVSRRLLWWVWIGAMAGIWQKLVWVRNLHVAALRVPSTSTRSRVALWIRPCSLALAPPSQPRDTALTRPLSPSWPRG